EPLLKPSSQSRFGLIPVKDKDGYIWRVDKSKMAVLDLEGQILFEKENPASDHLTFNCFYSNRPVFTIFDQSQDLLIIVDEKGRELTAQPLEATQIPSIEFLSDGKLRVNYVFKNKVSSLVI